MPGRFLLNFKMDSETVKILIVEDNAKARAMIRRFLVRRFRHLEGVKECKDGRSAVEVYLEFQPDWVLMDINLPVLDGLKATAKICREDQNAQVVMVTAYDDAEYREAADRAGACAYVLKENLEQLTGIIQ